MPATKILPSARETHFVNEESAIQTPHCKLDHAPTNHTCSFFSSNIYINSAGLEKSASILPNQLRRSAQHYLQRYNTRDCSNKHQFRTSWSKITKETRKFIRHMHTTPSPKQNPKNATHTHREQNHSAEKKEKSKLAEYKLQATEEEQEQQEEKSQAASGF